MKRIVYFLLSAIVLIACSSQPTLLNKKGVFYLSTEETPYTGEWSDYSDNGNLKSSVSYEKGKQEGKYTFWYDNGQKHYEGYKKNGKEDSLWTEWHDTGELKEQGTFNDGIKYHSWKKWDMDGNITYDVVYRDYTRYHDWNGVLHVENHDCFYEADNNSLMVYTQDRTYKNFYVIFDYKNGISERIKEIWHSYDQVYIIKKFKNELETDLWIWFDKDGAEIESVKYIEGIMFKPNEEKPYTGEFTFPEEPNTIYNYLDGIKHGEMIKKNDVGEIISTGQYLNNKKDGVWKSENYVCHYKNGEQLGMDTTFYDNGKVKRISGGNWPLPNDISYFENGIVSGETSEITKQGDFTTTIWNKVGDKLYEINYRRKALHGPQIDYYIDGQKKLETNYNYDVIHGDYIEYFSNDQIEVEGKWENGERDGKWSQWDNSGSLIKEGTYKDGTLISGVEIRPEFKPWMKVQ